MVGTLAALVAFVDEHHRRGELDCGRDNGYVWLTCSCGAQVMHSASAPTCLTEGAMASGEGSRDAVMDELVRSRTALNVDAWWDEPAYKTCNTLHLRGAFILRKLRAHDPESFDDLMRDVYGEDMPDPEEIGRFEWRTILAFMGANGAEIEDVHMRMGRPWR
jgi:hypothetical protein